MILHKVSKARIWIGSFLLVPVMSFSPMGALANSVKYQPKHDETKVIPGGLICAYAGENFTGPSLCQDAMSGQDRKMKSLKHFYPQSYTFSALGDVVCSGAIYVGKQAIAFPDLKAKGRGGHVESIRRNIGPTKHYAHSGYSRYSDYLKIKSRVEISCRDPHLQGGRL